MLLEFARAELFENILPYWAKYAPDGKNGGFIGEVSADNVPDYNAKKSLVLNARILWTFTAAYELTRGESWQKLAERAYVYIKTYFLDRDNGGAFYMLNPDGSVADDRKHVYANMFLVYAMSDYSRVFGSREALRIASSNANLLYRSAFDHRRSAFCEAFDREWKPDPSLIGVNKPGTTLTMNTHLHALEAFTALLRAEPDDQTTRRRLAEQLDVMLAKIVDPETHGFFMWFDEAWRPIGRETSYGHNIEGSWLIYEAASVLDASAGGNEYRSRVSDECAAMARACLTGGTCGNGAVVNEYDPETDTTDRTRIWWVEAEAVVGYYNAFELARGSNPAMAAKFLAASEKTAEYISAHISDRAGGDWFSQCDENEAPSASSPKIGAWKCPYHSSRMCIEIINRMSK